MLEGGVGPTQAAMALALFSLLCGLVAAIAMRLDMPHPALLGAFLAMCIGWYWLTSRRERAIAMFRRIYDTHAMGWRRGDPDAPLVDSV